MRKNISLLLIFCLCFMFVQGFAEPLNLGLEKQQLEQYYSSGKYNQDIAAVTKQAMYYLRFRVNQNKHLTKKNKLAIVLAVDETALSNYSNMKQEDFGGSKDAVKRDELQGRDPAIQPILSLYQYAIAHGVVVFFVSTRPESLKRATIKNLKKAGFTKYQALYFRPKGNTQSISNYKTEVRSDIEKQGYDIAVNLGDQYADLRGGHADMAFKLVNPFYLSA